MGVGDHKIRVGKSKGFGMETGRCSSVSEVDT